MAEIVALLPMKGHSERVTGKNLRPMAGRPLYHWIMDSLLATAAISEVVVDTDSEELADDVAANFGSVTIRERPDELRGDLVPMHDIVARFVSEHATLDHVVQTHATNPLLTSETLARAIETYLGDESHDSLMSVTEKRVRLFDDRSRPLNHDPEVLLRTQDLAPVYEENSNIYIASRAVVTSTGMRTGTDPLLFPIDRFESLDIDEEVDFTIVECLLERRRG
jgi:CMP-N-acetylneuraminic acid synthetase